LTAKKNGFLVLDITDSKDVFLVLDFTDSKNLIFSSGPY